MEYELYPRPGQIELAHHLAELGVDAIVGHHPHVVQPVEYYRTRRDAERVVPVFYSLGNLTNPFSAPHLCRSGVARVALARGATKDGNWRTYVKSATLSEVVQVADIAGQKLSLQPA
jgi:poly-gamma-glutamate synthesis protein (capsule biosynthesis protein)